MLRMRNSASTFVYAEYVRHKFQTRYEHATVRLYTLSYCEVIQKKCACIKNRQAERILRIAYTFGIR